MPSHASKDISATTVGVTAPGRLHLGFLDLDATLGRRYGSIGLAIDQPNTTISLSSTDTTDTTSSGAPVINVRGAESLRAEKLLRKSTSHFKLTGNVSLAVESALPAHAGLGSGTQLALAIGTAAAHLTNQSTSAKSVASALGRGARSAIGIAAFEHGGFLVDGGRGTTNAPAPLISRIAFPNDWHILLVLDQNAEGVHGPKEREAFANLPPMPQSTAAHLCHLTLMRLLPAVAERDLETFGTALTEIQTIVGERFAPHQGGDIWASKRVGHFMQELTKAGAVGIGQSSWGPTSFAFTSSASVAQNISRRLKSVAQEHGLDLQIVRGRNSGASVTKNGPRIGHSNTNKNPMELPQP